jgi:predicted nucleic acid-binding protein
LTVILIHYAKNIAQAHPLIPEDKEYLESCIDLLQIIEVSHEMGLTAVKLRQHQKLGLGDSIIAATALVCDYEWVTRNVGDFRGIRGLKIVNPFDSE